MQSIKYSISNIILRIEMSIVNLKIIFVKKQKQTRGCPTQGRGGGRHSFITEMAVFPLDMLETGYPFDNSRQKDCTETLSAVPLSIGLTITRGKCVSGHVVRASFFLRYATEMPSPGLRGKTPNRD